MRFLRLGLLLLRLALLPGLIATPIMAQDIVPPQDPLPPLDDRQVRVFGVEDGLPVSNVIALGQDAEGYLYAGGGRGLVRFEGDRFEPVQLEGFPTRRIRRLHLDRAGRLWIQTRNNDFGYVENERPRALPPPPARVLGFPLTSLQTIWLGSEQGLLRFDPETGSYTAFTRAHGLPSDSVSAVVEMPDGEQVVVTARGLARMELGAASRPRFTPLGRSFRLVVPHSEGAVYRDREALWLRAEEGIMRYRTGHLRTYRTPDDPARGPVHVDPADIVPRKTGSAIAPWLAERFPIPLDTRRRLGAPRALALKDGDGTRWFSAWDPTTSRAHLMRAVDGRYDPLPLAGASRFRVINDLFLDHEGGVWTGTDRGLIHIAPRRVAGLRARHGLEADFTTAVRQTADGSLWVGSWGGGLHRFHGGQLEHYDRGDGLPTDRVRGLYEASDGTLWVSAVGGLSALRRRDEAWQVVRTWPTQERVRNVTEVRDRDGVATLWIAQGTRLRRGPADAWARGTGALFRDFRPDIDWGSEIWALHEAADGSLWVGSRGGLFRIAADSVRRFGREQGLRGRHVSSIHEEDDGTLWFGTYEHGLHRYRGQRLVAITTREGLHHDGVWTMLDDGRGYVWMSSDAGIFRVEWTRLHEVADALERGETPRPLNPLVFTEAEGSPSRESNRASPGGYRLMDGRLVFNSVAGLVVIDPERAARPPPPPPTRIRAVHADGAEIERRSEGIPRLAAGVRHVDFEFIAISFASPEQTRYRYRLDGYDEDWIDGASRRRASYTGLAPGRYTFRVQGATGTGLWSEAEAAWAFVVPPLFWQTWWFRVMLILAVAGALALAHRTRVTRLVAMERLRLRIASDLHDDVGSNLSSIALLSEMLRDRTRVEGLERRQLERISRAADETITSLREIIWLVDPEHDNLADLVQRMRNTATDLLNGTSARFVPRGPPDHRSLDPAFVRHVFLIYKEALNNVAKHADARHVRIEVGAEQGMFTMRIEDDGCGFREERVARGHGLASMRRRAEEVGGELSIESTPGGGTRITFRGRMG